MKLSTYNPSVTASGGTTARVQVPNDPRAYGDNSAALKLAASGTNQLARGIGSLNAAILQKQEDDDAVQVQAALNDYNKRVQDAMYNQESGLMHTELQGAAGVTGSFEEQEKKIREDVLKNYKFGFAKSRQVFLNRADSSAASSYGQLMRHEATQAQAYKKVTVDNALTLCAQNAAQNYASPELVAQQVDEAARTVTAHYYGQGDEAVKAYRRKVVAQVAGAAISNAYANGDVSAAESYVERYGGSLDPQTLANLSRSMYQDRMRNYTRSMADALIAQHGGNLNAIYKGIYQGGAGESGYDGEKAVAYMRQLAERGANFGVNTCTTTANKAIEAGGGLPGNVWAPTNWKEAKDAGTAFTDKSQLRSGDLVYWWQPGKDEDENDVGHVGIYDASTGQVYQSGTHGVAAIPLGTYQISGFAHPQGRGMTLAQKDQLWQAVQHQSSVNRMMKQEALHDAEETLREQCMELRLAGETDPQKYLALVPADNLYYDRLHNLAMGLAPKPATGGIDSGVLKMDKEGKIKLNGLYAQKLESSIISGKYSATDVAQELSQYGAPAELVNDWTKKALAAEKDVANWQAVKEIAKQDFKGDEKALDNAIPLTARYIRYYTKKYGFKPTNREIADYMRISALDVNFGYKTSYDKATWPFGSGTATVEFSPADIFRMTRRANGLGGIYRVQDAAPMERPNGEKVDMVNVWIEGSDRAEVWEKNELLKMLGVNPLEKNRRE